jgi:BirA family biotin operon repressor/biotin-[acetyl-CoA-carboxylase] ligase
VKERLLDILEANPGSYVSGASLRSEMGITRSAIWKWMEQLREDGYVIDAVPSRGYQLVKKPDRLYPWEVRRGLETQIIGRDFCYEPILDSTNKKCKELARNNGLEGLVVLCEEQTAGRGRRGKSWVSPAHAGIYCSVLLRPQIPLQWVPQISLMTAVALQEVIEGSTIKWPNDLLIDGRKCCGILVEVDAEPDLVKAVIVGFGINVNVDRSQLPPEVQETATSLLISLEKRTDRVELLQRVLSSLEHTYEHFLRDGFAPVLAQCKEKCSTLGQDVVVQNPRGELVGRAIDIAEDGALVVQEPGGNLVPVYAGEVSVRTRTSRSC